MGDFQNGPCQENNECDCLKGKVGSNEGWAGVIQWGGKWREESIPYTKLRDAWKQSLCILSDELSINSFNIQVPTESQAQPRFWELEVE